MQRFLSKREKPGEPSSHRRDKSRDKPKDKTTEKAHGKSSISGDTFRGIFKPDPQKKADKELSIKISTIKDRLRERGFSVVDDSQINYALTSEDVNGDVEKALELIILYQMSVEGTIKEYNPNVHMEGAVNRENVTCYLDALLFAMFAKLGSFEGLLHNTFEDEPRRKLVTLIRLWVNMLRSGKLIHTDVTQFLQNALVECGWKEAGEVEQQDTSEAFSFITETLGLPLLSLTMDIYHEGKGGDPDDHKVVQERLLEVALPTPEDRNSDFGLKLEECLENYFNNRIEVRRKLERSEKRSPQQPAGSHSDDEPSSEHIEEAESSWAGTPTTWAESSATPLTPTTPTSPGGRRRAPSLFQKVVQGGINEDPSSPTTSESTPQPPQDKLIKVADLPAWQMFNLIRPSTYSRNSLLYTPANSLPVRVLIGDIAWFTSSRAAESDAEVVENLQQGRPVLGICLKRYSMTENGEAKKNDAIVDIPLDIRLPHFVEGDEVTGNFKLSLQSVVCHQGNSVNSGHYIAYVRGLTKAADGDIVSTQRLSNSEQPPQYPEDRWIKHDDLAHPRVSNVTDITEELIRETPYLLFYQVQPTEENSLPSCSDVPQPTNSEKPPPSYADSCTDSGVELKISSPEGSTGSYLESASNERQSSIRFSSELERHDRGSLDGRPDERRGSTAMTDGSMASTASSIKDAGQVIPNDESTTQRISRSISRFTKSGSRSRPTSASGENRLSATFQRMNWKPSKELLRQNGQPKDQAVGFESVQHADDPPPSSRNSLTVDEGVARASFEGSNGQSKTKLGKRRAKSKDPLEPSDHRDGKTNGQEKGKRTDRARPGPDRECIMM